VTDWTSTLGNVASIVSFGTDSAGNVYIVSIGGTVYRIEAS
jgi:hypothetical protein